MLACGMLNVRLKKPGSLTNEPVLWRCTWNWSTTEPRNVSSRALLIVRLSGISLLTVALLLALLASGRVGVGPSITGGSGIAAAVKIARPFVVTSVVIAWPPARDGIATFF